MELLVQQVEEDGVEVAVEEFLWIVIAYRKMWKLPCMVCSEHLYVVVETTLVNL